MVDYNKLSQVTDSKRQEAEKKPGARRVSDSKKGLTEEQKKKIKDAIAKRKGGKASPKFAAIKVKDSYKNLLKKIKDELEETETTDAAIECALANITPETPAEDVLAAVMETLGETIDELSEQDNAEEDVDDIPEDELEETIDSLQTKMDKLHKRLIDSKKKIYKRVKDSAPVKVTTFLEMCDPLWKGETVDVSEWADDEFTVDEAIETFDSTYKLDEEGGTVVKDGDNIHLEWD